MKVYTSLSVSNKNIKKKKSAFFLENSLKKCNFASRMS